MTVWVLKSNKDIKIKFNMKRIRLNKIKITLNNIKTMTILVPKSNKVNNNMNNIMIMITK